ncbi:MAG: sodium:calcium antiporter [Bdellovibrionales bacterium]|jgi:cation:H+ antiporter|nr:sodium:calcium antiporter [Bdellovibrionales bacterium]MBT3525867.1 sodium:calcium antiporter [Bdellovibrionales bacterium]MBT7668393.1 sodium:calcium antiporter [Bdellovibrionales bacterium]MBT7766603.1 sodium:calcium antiporter [Bdellovibrionales bacterium]
MLTQVLLLTLSMVGLFFGAEFTLDGAEKVGRFFKLSPLVIGLLIVGFGTSLPELFVSHISCLEEHPNIALGNIIGSNIANLFLIMGVAGLLVPLHLSNKNIQGQLWWHLALTLMLIGVVTREGFSYILAIPLVIFFLSYLFYTFKIMERSTPEEATEQKSEKLGVGVVLKLLSGFALLYLSGELLVNSGSKLAIFWGVSDYVISAILIALGTSFPELITALLACIKKKDVNLITGNVLGSNVFNVAFVMGSLGVYQFPYETTFYNELGSLIFASLSLLALAYLGLKFHRLAGVAYLSVYLGMVYLWI